MGKNNNNGRGSNLKKAPLQSRGVASRGYTQWRWLMQLESIALSRFKWTGLPDSIDERFLERTLLVNGQAVFFKLGNELKGTQVQLQPPFDIYHNPYRYTAIGDNNFRYEIPDNEGVVVWDSMTRKLKYPYLVDWADELAELDELTRVNRRQQRNLVVFSGPEERKNDLAALTRDLEMNESNRITVGHLAESGVKIEAINTGIEYKQEKFHSDRSSTLNIIYSFLGIEHIPFEKNERLISGEADIATDIIARMREDALVPRKQAAKQLSELFGIDGVDCTWRRDENEMLELDNIARGEVDE